MRTMFITNKAISRRQLLRGSGAAVALPFLGAMVPALGANATPRTPSRLAFFYVPNGIVPASFHPAGDGGRDYAMTPVLAPLEALRDHVTVLSGLSNIATARGGGGHSSAHSGWLNGAPSKKTEGSDIRAGKTLDQYAADSLGADTILRSLELTTESSIVSGLCELGYSCVYRNSTSWLTPTTPLPHENDPRRVFERLFGSEATPAARRRELANDRSILDSVGDELDRLTRSLGVGDRRTVDDYTTAIRDVESRIEKIERSQARDLGRRDDATDRDSGRLRRPRQDPLRPAALGLPGRHHPRQLHPGRPRKQQPQLSVDRRQRRPPRDHAPRQRSREGRTADQDRHLPRVAFQGLHRTLEATPDGDGTLLDHALLVYGGGLGDGNTHSFSNLPLLVAGGAGGHRGGRHLKYPMDTPLMNAGLSLLDKVGVHIEQVGDSTGRLAAL